jgi:hypothetical protein
LLILPELPVLIDPVAEGLKAPSPWLDGERDLTGLTADDLNGNAGGVETRWP